MLNPIDKIREWYSKTRPDEGWAEYSKNFVYYRLSSVPMAFSAVSDAVSSAFTGLANAFSSVSNLGKATFSWLKGEPSDEALAKAGSSAKKTARFALRTALFTGATPLAPLATLIKPSWGATIYEKAHLGLWLHESVLKDAEETRDTAGAFDEDWGRADYYLDGTCVNVERGVGVKGATSKLNFLNSLGGDQDKWKMFMHQGWAAVVSVKLFENGYLPVGEQTGFSIDVRKAGKDFEIVISGKCSAIEKEGSPLTSDAKTFDYTRTTTIDPRTMFILNSQLVIKEEL